MYVGTKLLHSPTVGSLKHDRIAIEQQVENEDPSGLREPPDSQAEQRDGKGQDECRAMTYLRPSHRHLGAIQRLPAVRQLRGHIKAKQHGPQAIRDDPLDESDSEPTVEHGLEWFDGLEKGWKA
jgi:hypothetical protein